MNYILGKDSLIDAVLSQPERYHFQFIYTQVHGNEEHPQLLTADFSTNSYFYPASIVKLPVALVVLEKLAADSIPTNAFLSVRNDQNCGHTKYSKITQSQNISFQEMINHLMIVSNNDYYNAFYHYITPKVLNDTLINRGIYSTKIYKSFTGCEFPENLYCNPTQVRFPNNKKVINQSSSRLEEAEMMSRYYYDSTKLFGLKHEWEQKIIEGPYDFNYNIEYPLKDIHSTLTRLIFPTSYLSNERWKIRGQDRLNLIKAMSSCPSFLKGKFSKDKKHYPDNLYKYIVLGDNNPNYNNILTYSKIGISHGFVTETAYVHDISHNIRYLLSANIYVNNNKIVNDGIYEYEETARPFLAKFGQLLIEYEKSKKR
ncbi:MAG: serine hydrolase [Crocinitomicaceae bacterium]|nr:serine hydrolase [Crocinitomicaceae bacterium]